MLLKLETSLFAQVKYVVVSGFIFLRFFAPAILGPRLFQLRQDTPDALTQRTLTLISKAIQVGDFVGKCGGEKC